MLRKMENMTWLEMADAVKETDTVLVPIGAIEMQGPHLPLVVDSLAAQYVAEKVAEKTNTVLAPLINVGTSEWHKYFPGIISLSKTTLLEYLRDYCNSLVLNGFKRILFFSPHVINDDVIASVGLELREKGILVGSVNLWHISAEIVQNKNIEFEEKNFTHAGEIMTSVIMAIAPELVKMDKAETEYPRTPIPDTPFAGLHKLKYRDTSFSIFRFSNEETTSGSLGNPMAATPEKGQKVIDGWLEVIVPFVGEFQKCTDSTC
ncbi:MAG: creatininase family protein [Bacillota bacterium]|nr:creatininase family protein [Bacillota bacterium]